MYRHGAETVKKVAPELPLRDHLLQVLVRRGYESEIALHFLLASNRPEAMLLQHPQKCLLQRQRQFPISSRNRVPLWACLMRPSLRFVTPR